MKKQDIKDLMKFFDETDITKFKIKDGDFELSLEKETEVVAAASIAVAAPAPTPVIEQTPVPSAISAPVVDAAPKADGLTIKSPMVGTFYKAPAPGAEPFAKVGTVIKKGQPVAIIEAMKIMNEIEAEYDCRILEILVDDGQPVEFDMPLFVVEKV